MSLRRHDAKRDANEPCVIAAFEAMGCMVKRLDMPCDLLVNIRGVVHMVEVKTKRGTLTKSQAADFQYWPIHIIRTVDEAIALVQGARRAA